MTLCKLVFFLLVGWFWHFLLIHGELAASGFCRRVRSCPFFLLQPFGRQYGLLSIKHLLIVYLLLVYVCAAAVDKLFFFDSTACLTLYLHRGSATEWTVKCAFYFAVRLKVTPAVYSIPACLCWQRKTACNKSIGVMPADRPMVLSIVFLSALVRAGRYQFSSRTRHQLLYFYLAAVRADVFQIPPQTPIPER